MAETITLTKLEVRVKHMQALIVGLTRHQEGETVINLFGQTICVWTNCVWLLYLSQK